MLWILLALGCGAHCDCESQAWELVSPDATDCGQVMSCMAEAVQTDEPAVVRSTTSIGDSVRTTVHVWTGDHYWLLRSDSRVPDQVDAYECVTPAFAGDELDCGRIAPEGNHFQVCGGRESGSLEPLAFAP